MARRAPRWCLALAALLLARAGHALSVDPPRGATMLDDAAATQAAVSRLVPVGTTVPNAIRRMEADGYKCVRTVPNASGPGTRPGDGTETLSCGFTDHGLLHPVRMRWTVTFPTLRGAVADPRASVGQAGP